MRTKSFSSSLSFIAAAVCLGLAWPAFDASAKTPPAKAPKAESSPAASPAAEARPFPFQSTVISVDKAAHSFRIGKKTVHQVHVLPETKLTKGEEAPAAFEDIIVGVEIRGSVHKRANGDYEAVSLKIGPKAEASPTASPAPSAAPTAAAPSPSPSPKASQPKASASPKASPKASPTAKP